MTQRTSPGLSKYLTLLLVLASCNNVEKTSSDILNNSSLSNYSEVEKTDKNLQDTAAKFNDIEYKIIDSLFQLKEIKDRQKYIEQQTKGARHLQIIIADKPNLTNKYYWMKVAEDNGTNFVTHFNFYVYPDPIRIMFFDTQDDRELTLNKWRKQKSK